MHLIHTQTHAHVIFHRNMHTLSIFVLLLRMENDFLATLNYAEMIDAV